MTISRCDELGSEFASLCVEREHLRVAGDIKAANRVFDRSRRVAVSLMAERQDRAEVLGKLIEDEREEVVLGAACYLLPIDEERALAILSEIEAGSEVWEHSITAKYCRKEWIAGNMNDIRGLK
jgi:hypothetical protein